VFTFDRKLNNAIRSIDETGSAVSASGENLST